MSFLDAPGSSSNRFTLTDYTDSEAYPDVPNLSRNGPGHAAVGFGNGSVPSGSDSRIRESPPRLDTSMRIPSESTKIRRLPPIPRVDPLHQEAGPSNPGISSQTPTSSSSTSRYQQISPQLNSRPGVDDQTVLAGPSSFRYPNHTHASSSSSSRHPPPATNPHGGKRSGSGSSPVLRLHEVSPSSEPSNRLSTELQTFPSIQDAVPPPLSAQLALESQYALSRSHSMRTERDEEAVTSHNEREKGKSFDLDPLPQMSSTVISRSSWWRSIIPSSWSCRLFVLVVLLEAIFDIIIEANILWRFNIEVKSDSSTEIILENRRRLPIYLIIFGLAHLWQIVLTFVAVRSKNTIQVIAVTLFNYALLGYGAIMIYELRKILGDLSTSLQETDGDNTSPANAELLTLPLNVLTYVVIAILAVGCVAMTALAWRMRQEFGWLRYRFLGADLQIRKLYQRFQIFECICYFTAFFCAGFGVQFIWLVLQPTDVEYIITWIMFPLSLILLILGRFAAKYENKWLMYIFLLGIVLGQAYFFYKLVRIWQSASTTYVNLTKSMTLFDALSIVSLGACGVWGVWVGMSFGRGLKEAILSSPNGSLLTATMNHFRARDRSRSRSKSLQKSTSLSVEKGTELQLQSHYNYNRGDKEEGTGYTVGYGYQPGNLYGYGDEQAGEGRDWRDERAQRRISID